MFNSEIKNKKGIFMAKKERNFSGKNRGKTVDKIQTEFCLSHFQKLILVIFFSVVLCFYLWTSSSNTQSMKFDFSQVPNHYYNYLSDAFLNGKLHLLIEPKKELLELPDPYDPKQNVEYRLHDASLYKGKYYLYFGAAPAITLFIPFRLITKHFLPENLAIVIFGFGGVIWYFLLLHSIVKKFFPAIRFNLYFLAIVSLGLCNVIPFILRRPEFYEVAISSGYFFMAGSLYFLITGAFITKKASFYKLLIGSLFLGLAVGSRPNLIIGSLIFLPIYIKILKEECGSKIKNSLKHVLYLAGPFLVCLFIIGLYNYLRFDSWIEFGNNYQLAGINVREKGNLASFSNITNGFYNYFFRVLSIDFIFPFFYLVPSIPYFTHSNNYGNEPVASIFSNLFLFIILLFPFLIKKIKRENYYLFTIICYIFIVGLLAACSVSIISGATMRYEVDFISFFIIGSFFILFYITSLIMEKKLKLILNYCICFAVIISVLYNVGVSFTGYYDNLKYGNPKLYWRIAKCFYSFSFKPDQENGPALLTIEFPQITDNNIGMTEPILLTGDDGKYDLLFVKYISKNQVAFGLDHDGSPILLSNPIEYVPGKVYTLMVEMGSLYNRNNAFIKTFPDFKHLFRVIMDNSIVIQTKADFYLPSDNNLLMGKGSIGCRTSATVFSGKLYDFRRLEIYSYLNILTQ